MCKDSGARCHAEAGVSSTSYPIKKSVPDVDDCAEVATGTILQKTSARSP